jgi:microcystin-dependent protein
MNLHERISAGFRAVAADIKNLIGGMPAPGEIRLHAGETAPHGWAFCDGQLLPIATYPALFVTLGARFGGNGVTEFALPTIPPRPSSGVLSSQVGLGDQFSVVLPDGFTACYAVANGDTAAAIAAGLYAAITGSDGYAAQPLTASLAGNEITLTGKTPGVGFSVSCDSPTVPMQSTVVAPDVELAQVDRLIIQTEKFSRSPAVKHIIYLGSG